MARREPPLRNGSGARALLMPRVSTLIQQNEGTSLQTQEEAMRTYCAERRYMVHTVLPDTYTGTELDRPALNEARRMIRAEEVDVVVIYAYDRFFRNETYQTIVLHEARQHGVSVEAVTEQLDDTPTGRMVRTMLGLVAEVEHEKILERTTRGLRKRVELGKLKTGAVPLYGYRWVYVRNGSRETRDAYEIDEETAPIVRWLYEDAARGVSLRELARQLQARAVPTPSQVLLNRGELGDRPLAPKWHRTIIARILRNPAYKGELWAYRRQVVDTFRADKGTGILQHQSVMRERDEAGQVKLPEHVCPALVEQGVWDTVQVRLARNKAEAARNNRDVEGALLRAGHIYCGHCNRRARTMFHRQKGKWLYRCQFARADMNGGGAAATCPVNGTAHVAQPIDQEVWRRIEASLAGEGSGPSLLEQALLYRQEKQSEQVDGVSATQATIQDVIATVQKRRDNTQRALDNALAKDYDETTVEAITAKLDEANRELRRLIQEQSRLAALEEARRHADAEVSLAIEHLKAVGGRIHHADYATKRRWLWLLGVRVYLYRPGAYDDGAGNRWRVEFAWDGLNALVAARVKQQPQ